jgi:putative cell wall-binding protein
MLSRRSFRLSLVVALIMLLGTSSPAFAAIARSTVMARAQQWVEQAIPYSQTGWADVSGTTVTSPKLGWRRDCSGFTSMAWNLPLPGESSRTLQYRADLINKAALQPGDALISYNNHAVVFGGWSDAEQTSYFALEMSSSASKVSTIAPDGTIARVTPYPYWGYNATYIPYRLRGITGNVDYSKAVKPVAGANRYATAVAASQVAFSVGPVKTAVVACGENWPDALGASALAGAVGGPILLTPSQSLAPATAAELRRLGVSEVILAGGTAAVTAEVARALSKLGFAVMRIGGANRYETARLLAEETAKRVRASGRDPDGTVFIATGLNFPDALAASPVAYAMRRSIILTPPDALAPDTLAALKAVGARAVVILGGTGPVSAEVENQLGALMGADKVLRLSGSDRYATSNAVVAYARAECGLSYSNAAVATGASFPDALAGGAMTGKLGGVLLLTPHNLLDMRIADLMRKNATEFGAPFCLGGEAALKPIVRESIALSLAPVVPVGTR